MPSLTSYPLEYEPTASNWYQSLPYGFDWGSGINRWRIYLPIAPQNLSITMSMATNIVTTLYGVAEEHSPIRYYDIVINGNTGIGPQYIGMQNIKGDIVPPLSGYPEPGRSSFQAGLLARLSENLGGLGAAVTGRVQAIADTAMEIGGMNINWSGLRDKQSGYFAFHALQLALMQYKQYMIDNSAKTTLTGSKSSLQFFNYKDNQRFDCIPVSFSMSRSADNPLLYTYSIRLRAFNLQPVSSYFMSKFMPDMASQLGLGRTSGDMIREIQQKISLVNTLVSGIL